MDNYSGNAKFKVQSLAIRTLPINVLAILVKLETSTGLLDTSWLQIPSAA